MMSDFKKNKAAIVPPSPTAVVSKPGPLSLGFKAPNANDYTNGDPAVRRSYFLKTKSIDPEDPICRKFLRKLDAETGTCSRLDEHHLQELKARMAQRSDDKRVARVTPFVARDTGKQIQLYSPDPRGMRSFRVLSNQHKTLDSKNPEKKAEKKARRKEKQRIAYERGLTDGGSSWWDGLMKTGAEILPKILPMLIGMGDYEDPSDAPLSTQRMPDSNSFLAKLTKGKSGYQVPAMHSNGSCVRIAHREYLGDIYSSTQAFVLLNFPLNPGMMETFPWLAPLANQFANYRFMGALVEFVSQGTDYANTAGLGYVALACQYNPLTPVFANKRDMLNYEFANADKPSKSFAHWIECRPDEIATPEKFVRAGTIPANADLRLYDHGRLAVAVGGNSADGQIIGQLWITYDVEFYFPRIGEADAGVLNFCSWFCDLVTASEPLGAGIVSFGSRSTFIWRSLDPVHIQFPDTLRGDFQLFLRWSGSAGSAGNVPPGVTFNSAITFGAVTFSPVLASGNVTCWMNMTFSVVADGGTITFSTAGTALPGGTNSVSGVCFQIPRAPTSSPIFDSKGKNETVLYEKFMDTVREKELVSLGYSRRDEAEKFLEKQRELKALMAKPSPKYQPGHMGCAVDDSSDDDDVNCGTVRSVVRRVVEHALLKECDCSLDSFFVVIGSEKIDAVLRGEVFITRYLSLIIPRHKEFLKTFEMMSGAGFQSAVNDILSHWDEDVDRIKTPIVSTVNPSTVTLGGVVYTATPTAPNANSFASGIS